MKEYLEKKSVYIPAKVMLAGEYSVLFGGKALSSSIDCYHKLQFTPSEDNTEKGLTVESNIWDKPLTLHSNKELNDINSHPLKHALEYCGCVENASGRLKISSEAKISYGLGSSSAVIIGILTLFCHNEDRFSLIKTAQTLQKKYQQYASGYDVITQALGGLLLIKPELLSRKFGSPLKDFHKIPNSRETLQSTIHIFVGGKGAPTTEVLTDTLDYLNKNKLIPELVEISDQMCDEFLDFIKVPSIQRQNQLFKTIKRQRSMFENCKYYPKALFNELGKLEGAEKTWTYKTTGAGGEDAILIIGHKDIIKTPTLYLKEQGWYKLPHRFSETGVRFSTND